MKNKILKITLIIIVAFLTLNTKALDIDPTRIGSISGTDRYGETVFHNNEVFIYKIANVDADGNFTYLDSFNGIETPINGLSTEELTKLSLTLNKYINDNNIQELSKTTTGEDGKFTFTSLSTGLYLLRSSEYIEGDYKYTSLPSLISVPNYNEIEKYYMYDIQMVTKNSAEYIGVKPDDDGDKKPTPSVPNTIDHIILYIVLFIISLIIVPITIYYIVKSMKGSGSDDKKKDNTINI